MNHHASLRLSYLLHHLAFSLDRQSDQVLQERLGVGFSQFKILLVLSQHDKVRQRQIADFLGQTEASVSRQIKVLQNIGALQSRINPKNRRERIVVLMPAGEQLLDQCLEVLDTFQAPFYKDLSQKQKASLSTALGLVHQSVCTMGTDCLFARV